MALTDALERAEHQLAAAVRASDVEAASPLLDNEFTLTSALGTGFRLDRESWLASLPSVRTTSLEFDAIQAEVFGDVGIVVWRLEWHAAIEDDDLSGPYVVTDVWRRASGGWRLRWRTWARLNAQFLTASP